jgi:hypothetical protein
MRGLGDNIYQRAFIKNIGPCWIDTPWPELYEDIEGVRFVTPITTLRTQLKNIQRNRLKYRKAPGNQKVVRISYGKEGIVPGMRRAFGVDHAKFDLPDFGQPMVAGKYALIRPVTLRREWRADSRNPLPGYINESVEVLRAAGYKIVSVADLEPKKEWMLGRPYKCDVELHRGELNVRELLALYSAASVCVGGVGWIVPAAVSTNVPTWVIAGGYGGYNAPEKIVPFNKPTIGWAIPDKYCKCWSHKHECNKTISSYSEKFRTWIDALG